MGCASSAPVQATAATETQAQAQTPHDAFGWVGEAKDGGWVDGGGATSPVRMIKQGHAQPKVDYEPIEQVRGNVCVVPKPVPFALTPLIY